VIGFAIAAHCKSSLVTDALKMAIATRGGHVAGVIMHRLVTASRGVVGNRCVIPGGVR
jgi:hypothetical protein